jgi:drug/metabolite transporter (DMT)-like permease
VPSWSNAEVLNPVQERRSRLIGIALVCGAFACFSYLDTTAKYLNLYMATLQVVWARYTGAFVFALVVSNPFTRPELLRTRRPFLQIGRSTLLLASTCFNFLALRYLQLDEATAIAFSTPFFVAALSGPMLGEWVRWRRWTAIAVGFVGVLVVIRPSPANFNPAALLSVGAAICYALYAITTRMLSRSDSNETTVFYSNLVGVLALLPVLPFVWVTPQNPLIVAVMVLAGFFGGFGHYLFVRAHRLAPVSVLAPFAYTQLLWVIVLGYLVFDQLPSMWTLGGSAIVIVSGLYLLNRERKRAVEASERYTS